MASARSRQLGQGFTLLEMAIVLLVISYLLKQLLVPFGAQHEQSKRNTTAKQLAMVIEASIGFAVSRHRLPCPAGEASNGMERSSCTGADFIGFVPSATLGLTGPLDKQGRLLDSWGRPIIYAVSQSDHATEGEQGKPDFVSAGEMGNVGLPYLESELVVCRHITAGACARAEVRANQIPLLVLSLGADATRADHQQFNQDKDPVFVARDFSTQQNNRFDDLVHWSSESRLFYALVKAGTLQ